MKATLEFNIPEENSEFLHATNAGRYLSALCEFDERLRGLRKHGEEKTLAEDLIRAWFDAIENLDLYE